MPKKSMPSVEYVTRLVRPAPFPKSKEMMDLFDDVPPQQKETENKTSPKK